MMAALNLITVNEFLKWNIAILIPFSSFLTVAEQRSESCKTKQQKYDEKKHNKKQTFVKLGSVCEKVYIHEL